MYAVDRWAGTRGGNNTHMARGPARLHAQRRPRQQLAQLDQVVRPAEGRADRLERCTSWEDGAGATCLDTNVSERNLSPRRGADRASVPPRKGRGSRWHRLWTPRAPKEADRGWRAMMRDNTGDAG